MVISNAPRNQLQTFTYIYLHAKCSDCVRPHLVLNYSRTSLPSTAEGGTAFNKCFSFDFPKGMVYHMLHAICFMPHLASINNHMYIFSQKLMTFSYKRSCIYS